MTRKERFAELCDDNFGEVPSEDGPWHTSGEEDAAEVLYGDEAAILQLVLVTSGGEHNYLYNVADWDAVTRKIEDISDPTFGEGVLGVVDLDTGVELFPDWSTLKFK